MLLSTGFGQMTPNWNSFAMNWGGINPAHNGLNHHVELFTGLKTQWVGFDGAPKTMNTSLSIPFNDFKSDAPMFGMGIQIQRENIGAFSLTKLQVAGAANIQTNEENRLSLGIGFGGIQVGYDADKVVTNLQDNIVQRTGQAFIPQVSAGLSYVGKKYMLGLYLEDLITKNWGPIGNNSSFRTEYACYVRTIVDLNKQLSLVPSLRISYIAHTPINYFLLFKLSYMERFNVFVGTTSLKAFQFGIGGRINKSLVINYLFENGWSPVQQVNLNSHSIGLKIKLNTHGNYLKKSNLLFD